jgi:hypothetical protein
MVVLQILQLTKPYEENQAFLHQMCNKTAEWDLYAKTLVMA